MKHTTRDDYQEKILRVLLYLQNHLDETPDLEQLAGVAHLSPFHFHRVFSGMVGEGVAEHSRRLRLERAAHRLVFGDEPVTEIAFQAGYEAAESFSRSFKEMFGETPSGFRRARRPSQSPPAPSGVHYRPGGGLAGFTPVDTGGSKMQVDLKNIGPRRVAFMRHTGPYREVGETWARFCGWAGPQGLLGPEAEVLGLSHDDPDVTPPDKLRYDACLVVGPDFAPQGQVGVQEIAGGRYACHVHTGPYEGLKETYARLCGQWLPGRAAELAGAPAVEIYLNDPATTPPPELKVEIQLPLAE